MFDVLEATPNKLKSETVLGVASIPIFNALAELFNEACKILVPDIKQEQAINLCVPEYHKKLLLDIKKIAPSALTSKPPVYELLLTGIDDAKLHIGLHDYLSTPVRPDIPGPVATCDFELYDKLQKDIKIWYQFSHKISMAYWALMFFNQIDGSGNLGGLYTVEEFRYLFHGLQPIIGRAIATQQEDVEYYQRLILTAVRGRKRQTMNDHAYEMEKLNALNSLRKKFSGNVTRYPTYVIHTMRNEVKNINESISQALIFAEAKVEKPPNLFCCVTEDSFHPFFSDNKCDMIGLNPWNMNA